LQQDATIPFVQVAYECGFSDQSHMIKEFKLFSGSSKLLTAQTGRFRQMSNVDLWLEVYFMKHSRHPLEVTDQSHMIKEFKLFSGYTPAEYLSVCAPYSDYFSDLSLLLSLCKDTAKVGQHEEA